MTLSPRERQVVQLLVDEGLTTLQIAQRLRISKHTVNGYIQRIVTKLPPGDGPPIRRIVRWRITRPEGVAQSG